jgi:hypothetical protein
MSELNELIATSASHAYHAGELHERERIVKLLEPEVNRHYQLGLDASAAYLEQTIALIKGKQK